MASIPATFGTATVQGLSEVEARRRLKDEGPNELSQREGRGFIRTALEVVREPMILLLLAAGALYVALGDHAEAVLLVASIGFIIGIELYQERRTERTLEALRDLSSPRALVIRDGEQRRIAGHDVVRDDILALAAVAGGAVLLLALVLAVPALRGLFKFAALHADDLGLAIGVALLTLLLSEGLKLFGRRTTADATGSDW
jgi:magnesium-transporting ATPase (P-type)